MTLNVAQYIAPLNSGQVLNGYVQGVKQGTGISIAPDGAISLDTTGASALGFLVSSSTPAPVYNWSLSAANPLSILVNDGVGNLSWTTSYISAVPANATFPQTGAAVLPAGATGVRPPSQPGLLRYNTDFNRLEFSNGAIWIPVTPPSGSVFSFVSNLAPTANAPGDLWLNTSTNQEYVWDGVSWVPTSPLASSLIPGLVKIGSNIQIAPDGTISILPTTGVAGGVSNLGLTTVTDNVSSLSVSSALSANQGRLLQEQINALLVATNLTLAGLISGAGVMTYVTPEGALQGFTLGSPLPVSSVTNNDYFVIVDSPGGFTPPGGVFTTVTQGDWFLSSALSWQFLNVGYDPPYASETNPGVIEIATQAETDAGTDDTRAVTPLKLKTWLSLAVNATTINLSPAINGNTTVQSALEDAVYDITSTGLTVAVTSTPTGLFNLEVTQATETQLGGAQIATDVEAQALALDDVIITPLKLKNVFSSGALDANDILLDPLINSSNNVQEALEDAIYDISSSDTSITVVETATGQIDITVTQATETQLGGGQIATQLEADESAAFASDSVLITPKKLVNRTATETRVGLAEIATQVETEAGTDDNRIVTPLKLRDTTIYKSDFNAKGDILSASANDTPAILSVGANNQYLRADSTQVTGLIWDTIQAGDITVTPAINGNTDLDTILRDAIYDVTSANTSITVAIAATGLVTLTAVDATDTQKGVVELATPAEVETGTNTTLAVTPEGVRTAAVYKSDFNAKGDLLSATANDTPAILGVGTDGQVLSADSASATGLKWVTPSAAPSYAIYNLDDISGGFDGAAVTFGLKIGGVAYTPTPVSNIMVFVGGVPQIPGAGFSYTVTGSNITFTAAPPAGASFYATTVK